MITSCLICASNVVSPVVSSIHRFEVIGSTISRMSTVRTSQQVDISHLCVFCFWQTCDCEFPYLYILQPSSQHLVSPYMFLFLFVYTALIHCISLLYPWKQHTREYHPLLCMHVAVLVPWELCFYTACRPSGWVTNIPANNIFNFLIRLTLTCIIRVQKERYYHYWFPHQPLPIDGEQR